MIKNDYKLINYEIEKLIVSYLTLRRAPNNHLAFLLHKEYT